MTLILRNDQIGEDLLRMSELVDDIEEAFKDLSNGLAYNLPRERIFIPVEQGNPNSDAVYQFNNIVGAVPRHNSVALRIDLSIKEGVRKEGRNMTIRHRAGATGLVLLFDLAARELVSIMDDSYISWMRVGATSAVAAKYLARSDSRVLGLFGSGVQAKGQLIAMSEVFDLNKIKVYSPTRAHRESFAGEIGRLLGIDCFPEDEPENAARGSDIVSLATNTIDPVFFGRWAEEGMFIGSITSGDINNRRTEVDEDSVLRSDAIVVNTREQLRLDHQGAIYSLLTSGRINESQILELAEVVGGKAKGRQGYGDITLYANNHGMGLQFAVAAHRIYERARTRGLGQYVDTELFH